MPKRRAILHIGTAKTGSTSIQRMLESNRARLKSAGFAFPTSPGERNHFRLAIYAGRERADRMARATGESGDAAFVAEHFAAAFAREMRSLPASVHTVLLSNEHCYRKVDSALAVGRLRDLFAPWFDEVQVLVYLRRQDEMAVSLYSTRLRSGADRQDVLPNLDAHPQQAAKLDWHALVERWAGVFGRAAIVPRIFSREAFAEGDLITDYARAVGIEPVLGLERPEVANAAIAAPAQEFLRRINTALDDGGDELDEKAPGFVRGFVDRHLKGAGRRPSRAQALAFMARFEASNERLRQAWFPERPRLFGEDFSRYPETPDPVPSDTEVLEVALSLIAQIARERPDEEAEKLYQKAARLHAENDFAAARGALNKALGLRPGHAPALRLLLEMARAGEQQRDAAERLKRARRAEPNREDLAMLQAEFGIPFDPLAGKARRKPHRNGAPLPANGPVQETAEGRARGPAEPPADPEPPPGRPREDVRLRRRQERREARNAPPAAVLAELP